RGATLSFNLGELRGEDLANVRAYAVLIDGDNSVELPDGNQVVVEQRPDAWPLETQRSPSEISMTADLNPGDYAVGIEVGLVPDAAAALESQTTGSATYGFHIR